MPNIVANIPNFVSGVSQQPRTMRFPSQAEESVNTYPSVVEGLTKRPGTQHIKRLYTSFTSNDSASFFIDRSESEKYITEIRDGKFRVFDLSGAEKNVYYGGTTPSLTPTAQATTFLSTTGGSSVFRENFKFLNIADYTFVLNKSKYPQYTSSKKSQTIVGTTRSRRIKVALVTLKQLTERQTFRIRIDNYILSGGSPVNRNTEYFFETFTYVKPNDGSDQNPDCRISMRKNGASQHSRDGDLNATAFQTDSVMNTMGIYMSGGGTGNLAGTATGTYESLATSSGQGGWGFAYSSGTLAIWNTSTGTANNGIYDANGDLIWSISTSDSGSGSLLNLNWEEVQSFTDLPRFGLQNTTYKIVGYPQDQGDEYWVRFKAILSESGTNFGEGQWVETIEPGSSFEIDSVTMPWALVRLSSGDFALTPLDGSTRTYGSVSYTAPKWKDKICGDEETNPGPTFLNANGVQKTRINDIFFYKNRLGLLSEENIVFSESGEYFNFFKTTITQTLDSDPIDVASSSTNVSNINYAIPFFDRLLLFSETSQFTLASSDNLTPKSVSIQVSTGYSCLTGVSPVPAGKNIYFGYFKDNFSGIKEYFLNPENTFMDANEISVNVPKYIEGKINNIVVSETENVLCATTTKSQNVIYIYKYLNLGSERVQGAWSKFLFDSTSIIENIFFKKEILYILFRRTDGIYLEKIDFQSFSSEEYFPYSPRLDRLFPVWPGNLSTAPSSGNWVSGVTSSYNSTTNITTLTLPINFGNTNPICLAGGSYESDTSIQFTGTQDQSFLFSENSKDFYLRTLGKNGSCIIAGFFKPSTLSDQTILNLDKGNQIVSANDWRAIQIGIKNGLLYCAVKVSDNVGWGWSVTNASIFTNSWNSFVVSLETTGTALNQFLISLNGGASTGHFGASFSSTIGSSYLDVPSEEFKGNLDNIIIIKTFSNPQSFYNSYFTNLNTDSLYSRIKSAFSDSLISFISFDKNNFDLVKDIHSGEIIFDKASGIKTDQDQALSFSQTKDNIEYSSYSVSSGNSVITFIGQLNQFNGPLYFGIPYTMSHTITPINLRAPGQKGGQILVASAKFNLKYGYLAYTNTKKFDVVVSSNDPIQGNVYKYSFYAPSQPDTGVFKFPMFLNSENCLITLLNSSFYPSCFVSGDFEGTLTYQFQRT